MSGLFTAIENMPMWAQKITYFNPVRYFMEVVRLVLLKGAGFKEVQRHFVIMAVFSTAVISLAVLRYRKSSG
jgi:ABC-2 type transport system permease protein